MTKAAFLWLLVLLLALGGCGTTPGVAKAGSAAAAISISPTSVVAGSADLTLTITGSNFAGPSICASCTYSVAVWSVNGSNTSLATTFVSSTQLTAVVPAALLTIPVTAQVFVQTWEGQENVPRFTTSAAIFAVAALPVGAASITSISPSSATAGSPDITLTITGSNFANRGISGTSIAFWNGTDTMLATTFVSSSQLTAAIPAALLQRPGTSQVFVLTGDPMGMSDGFFGYPRSNSVTFSVAP